jgi:hypothetical protein
MANYPKKGPIGKPKKRQFVLINPDHVGKFSFDSYIGENGDYVFISNRKDQNGLPLKQRFAFQARTYETPTDQIGEFFYNSPFCEKEDPDLDPKLFAFREYDPERDASAKIEWAKITSEANNIALELRPDELAEVALICGYSGESATMQMDRVLDYAKANPRGFLEIIKDPEREARGLFLTAIQDGLIQKKGVNFFFDSVMLGSTDDEAIDKIYKDAELNKAIKIRLTK